jgi:hypothetical protein
MRGRGRAADGSGGTTGGRVTVGARDGWRKQEERKKTSDEYKS